MPVVLNTHDIFFPKAQSADEHGIVALGGDLKPERLLAAYRAGIFPWPHEGYPLLWFCPDPRFVLKPALVRINKSLKKNLLRSKLVIKADENFICVINNCAKIRAAQDGTWITHEMLDAYVKLFKLGYAHSVEAYENNILVGGLYGISIGNIFFGESMYCEQPNASKLCLVSLAAHLVQWGFSLIDCQAYTSNLAQLGAVYLSRDDFLAKISESNKIATHKGPWYFSLSLVQALALLQRAHEQAKPE
jgi:leucyl/phenylalanyl-tRNA--protein transferase